MKKVNLKAKIVVLVLILVSLFSAKAQDNYLITTKGEKVPIEGDASLTTQAVSFYKGKKEKTYLHTEISYLIVNGRQFLQLSLKGGKMLRLQEIVCYNDKYILTSFYQNGTYAVLVFDWNLDNVLPYKGIHLGMKKKQMKEMDEYATPYFSDCKPVMDKIVSNINAGGSPIEGIYAQKCGTKDISTLVQAFLSGQTNNGKSKE